MLLERRPALCTLTTAAATGGFRLQFDNVEELALVRESVEVFLNFAAVTGQSAYDPMIRQQGYLWLATEAETADRQRALVAMQHGWGQDDIELLDGDEVCYRFPYVAENSCRRVSGRVMVSLTRSRLRWASRPAPACPLPSLWCDGLSYRGRTANGRGDNTRHDCDRGGGDRLRPTLRLAG